MNMNTSTPPLPAAAAAAPRNTVTFWQRALRHRSFVIGGIFTLALVLAAGACFVQAYFIARFHHPLGVLQLLLG